MFCFFCFFVFLRPPDERKNPDWSELIIRSKLNLLFCFVRYMSLEYLVYTAGVRRLLLLATSSRDISFIICKRKLLKIGVKCGAKNNCSKEMIYKLWKGVILPSRTA